MNYSYICACKHNILKINCMYKILNNQSHTEQPTRSCNAMIAVGAIGYSKPSRCAVSRSEARNLNPSEMRKINKVSQCSTGFLSETTSNSMTS